MWGEDVMSGGGEPNLKEKTESDLEKMRALAVLLVPVIARHLGLNSPATTATTAVSTPKGTTYKIAHDPSNWRAEECKGTWCYAAVTAAVRKTLLGEVLSQEEIVHNFYMKINAWGAQISGTRGKAIAQYAKDLGLEPTQPAISYADAKKKWGPKTGALLKEAYGEVNLDDLKQDSIQRFKNTEDNERRVCQAIEEGGLVVVGTQLHFVLIYGYETDEPAQPSPSDARPVRRFLVWDPTNASTKLVDPGDDLITGQLVTMVTK
jgi:hypothetical protein